MPGDDGDDARHGAGMIGLDRKDARMGVGGADEMRVESAGKDYVVQIASLPQQEAAIFPSRHAPADLACGLGFVVCHRVLPLRRGWPVA